MSGLGCTLFEGVLVDVFPEESCTARGKKMLGRPCSAGTHTQHHAASRLYFPISALRGQHTTCHV